MPGVQERSIIVTGAGGGLGRSHALALAELGAKVVVNDLGAALDGTGGTRSAADAVVEEIVSSGGTAVANYDDVSTEAGGQSIVRAAVEQFGAIHGIVNNAGILRDRSFHKMSADEWDAVIKVHLFGAFNVTRAAWPLFREQRYGRVVVTTSVTGLYGNFGQANYGAAKLGLVGLANTLAIEGSASGVLVNALSPLARTRMSEEILDEGFDPRYASVLVAHLMSEECDVTGEIFHAAGGRYTRVRFAESAGVSFDHVPTIQDVRERWADVMSMTDASIAADVGTRA